MNSVDIEQVQSRTIKATMHTVEDTVGNALMSMKYLLMSKDFNHDINEEAQTKLLGVINDAMVELREISRTASVA